MISWLIVLQVGIVVLYLCYRENKHTHLDIEDWFTFFVGAVLSAGVAFIILTIISFAYAGIVSEEKRVTVELAHLDETSVQEGLFDKYKDIKFVDVGGQMYSPASSKVHIVFQEDLERPYVEFSEYTQPDGVWVNYISIRGHHTFRDQFVLYVPEE